MKSVIVPVLACAAILLVAGAAIAQTSHGPAAKVDSWVGEWTLNLQKSSYSSPAPKSGLSTLQLTANGIRIVQDQVDTQGNRRVVSFTGAFDGKEYPVDNSPGTTYALTRIDDHIYVIVARRDGVVTSTTLTVVSPDGRTRTSTSSGTAPDGRTLANVAVYDRLADSKP
jgi:hypothetical protein